MKTITFNCSMCGFAKHITSKNICDGDVMPDKWLRFKIINNIFYICEKCFSCLMIANKDNILEEMNKRLNDLERKLKREHGMEIFRLNNIADDLIDKNLRLKKRIKKLKKAVK